MTSLPLYKSFADNILMHIRSYCFILSGLFLLSCADSKMKAAQTMVQQTPETVGCQSFQYTLADELNSYNLKNDELQITPRSEEFRDLWSEKINSSKRFQNLSSSSRQKLIELLVEYQNLLAEKAPKALRERNAFYRQMGLGDRSVPGNKEVQAELSVIEDQMKMIVAQNQVNCGSPSEDEPTPTPPGSGPETVLKHSMKNVFATTYQSCRVLDDRPLLQSDDDVQGIVVCGKHDPGPGLKRCIDNVKNVRETHPYLRGQTYPSSCFNVKEKPLIYDFGGKPAYTNESKSRLDFFKDNGSGTSVLGYDCSGFVSSVLLNAGLKLKTSTPYRASDVEAASSYAFISPKEDGNNCLDRITMTENEALREGDIVAVPGHVQMIYRIGEDPFDIHSKRTVKECEQINFKRFDFDLIQSSSSKNGVGDNIYNANEYMKDNTEFANGYRAYAYQACLAQVQKKKLKPVVKNFSIVRHLQTEACKTAQVQLVKQECVQSCLSSR